MDWKLGQGSFTVRFTIDLYLGLTLKIPQILASIGFFGFFFSSQVSFLFGSIFQE